MASADDMIKLIIDTNIDSYNRGMEEAAKTTKKTRAEITLMASNLKNLGSIMLKTTKYSDDYTSSLRILETSLGKTTSTATKFISKLSEMSGFDQGTLTKSVSKFVQLGESLNLSDKYAEKFSENLTVLTTKLAMLYNIDFSVMAENVQKAIQGTQTTLKATTGIEATKISEQALLAEYGIRKQVSALNDAELAIVRYAAILRQVSNDNELYGRTVNSLAWQKQVLTAQIKNLSIAIGNLLTPAVTTAITALNGLLMAITEIVKMLASLVGGTVEVSTNVGSATNGFEDLGSGISKASKEAKKSLRSFDKLNNITTPTKGAGAAGGGLGIDKNILGILDSVDQNFLNIRNKATEIRDKIMEWLGFSKLVDENGNLIGWKYEGIGTTLKNIWTWFKKLTILQKIFLALGVIGFITNVWKLLKKVYNLLGGEGITKVLKFLLTPIKKVFSQILTGKKTVENTLTSMEKMVGALEGVAMMAGGIIALVDVFKDVKENGWSATAVIEAIAAALAVCTGAVTVLTIAFDALNVSTGGIVLVIGALLTAVAGLVTWFAVSNEKTEEAKTVTEEYTEKMAELNKQIKENTDVTDGQVLRTQELEDRLLNLVDANGKVNGSNEEANVIVKELNELLGTEYEITNGQIKLDGKLIKNKDDLKSSIDKYCSSLKAEAYLEAYREEYIERLKQQKNLKEELEKQEKALNQSTLTYNLTSEEGQKKWREDNAEQIKKMAELQTAYKTNEAELDNYQKASYKASVGSYDEATRLLTSNAKEVKVTSDDVSKKMISNYTETQKKLREQYSKTLGSMSRITIKVDADTSEATRKLTEFQKKAKIQTNLSPTAPFTAKADGGFLNQGELFVAREKGPEMVGTINGHTAVANNDQIVKGIQSGVFSAMMSALSQTNGNNANITIEATGDSEGLMKFISFKQKQIDRQFN